jgi:hypothetical protein
MTRWTLCCFTQSCFFKYGLRTAERGAVLAGMQLRCHPLCSEKSPDTSCVQQVINVRSIEGLHVKYFEMTHYSCVTELWTYLLLTVIHNTQSRIKHATCFGLLSNFQALIKNIKKKLNTAIGARTPPLVSTHSHFYHIY